jgi:signal transduction histidine kinase
MSLLLEIERRRISDDMHDELGSGITAIRLMSERAKQKLKENVPVELEKISTTATEMLNNINAIIWSMHQENDKVERMIAYFKHWAIEFFDNTGIDCKVIIDKRIPDKHIEGFARRNIFLCFKESLNNIMKHAAASNVLIKISYDPVFKIQVSDNGRGIDLNNLRPYSNGIKNMKKRMAAIGGSVLLKNKKGTEVSFVLSAVYQKRL